MPEVLTETEPQQGQASNAELCRMTLEHYEKVSRAAHEWNSAIPKAIALYYADPERTRLERLVIESAKAEYEAIETYQGNSTMENWHMIALAYDKRKAAVGALMNLESSQQQIRR